MAKDVEKCMHAQSFMLHQLAYLVGNANVNHASCASQPLLTWFSFGLGLLTCWASCVFSLHEFNEIKNKFILTDKSSPWSPVNIREVDLDKSTCYSEGIQTMNTFCFLDTFLTCLKHFLKHFSFLFYIFQLSFYHNSLWYNCKNL